MVLLIYLFLGGNLIITCDWSSFFLSFLILSFFFVGVESFSKLGDSIYFEEGGNVPGLYIIQFISSSLNWRSGRIVLNQKVKPVVSWDPFLQVSLSFSAKEVLICKEMLSRRKNLSFLSSHFNHSLSSSFDVIIISKAWMSGVSFGFYFSTHQPMFSVNPKPSFSCLTTFLQFFLYNSALTSSFT